MCLVHVRAATALQKKSEKKSKKEKDETEEKEKDVDQKDDKETKSSDEKCDKTKEDSPGVTEVCIVFLSAASSVICCALYSTAYNLVHLAFWLHIVGYVVVLNNVPIEILFKFMCKI